MIYLYTTYNNIKLTIYDPDLDSDMYCVFKEEKLIGKIFYDEKVSPSIWKTKYDNLKSIVESMGSLIHRSKAKNTPQPLQQ